MTSLKRSASSPNLDSVLFQVAYKAGDGLQLRRHLLEAAVDELLLTLQFPAAGSLSASKRDLAVPGIPPSTSRGPQGEVAGGGLDVLPCPRQSLAARAWMATKERTTATARKNPAGKTAARGKSLRLGPWHHPNRFLPSIYAPASPRGIPPLSPRLSVVVECFSPPTRAYPPGGDPLPLPGESRRTACDGLGGHLRLLVENSPERHGLLRRRRRDRLRQFPLFATFSVGRRPVTGRRSARSRPGRRGSPPAFARALRGLTPHLITDAVGKRTVQRSILA